MMLQSTHLPPPPPLSTELLSNILLLSSQHRTYIDDIILFFQSRITAEDNYARDLRTIADGLNKHLRHDQVGNSSMEFLLAALRSGATRRAVQVEDFAEHLGKEVLGELRELSKSQSVESERLEREGKSIESQLKSMKEKKDTFKQRAISVSKLYEQEFLSWEIMKLRCTHSPEQRLKQQSRLLSLSKQQNTNQQQHLFLTHNYTALLLNKAPQMASILSLFESQLAARVQKLSESIRKLMIFETAMMRNFDYDIINIDGQLQNVDPGKDVQRVRNQKGISEPEEVRKHWMGSLMEVGWGQKFETRIALEKDPKVLTFFQESIKESHNKPPEGIPQSFIQMTRIVHKCWKNQEIDQPSLTRFKELITSDTNRCIFHMAFKQYNGYFRSEMSSQSGLLFQLVIAKSTQNRDIYTIRKLLSVIFSKWTISKPKQLILYRSIQSLALWKNQDFWESSLFESIQQSLKTAGAQKGETREESTMREENLVLSQLASYCHIMIMLGSSQKSVKMVVGRYCRLHGLGEEQNKVLSKTIGETLVIYKQFN